jgi:hypothetical protein
MLQVNTFLRENEESGPFEDYSIFMYRQQAPEFNDRVKELEQKLLYPVRIVCWIERYFNLPSIFLIVFLL